MGKFNETILTEKEEFYCHLNMIMCMEKGFVKILKKKNLRKYHDLYVQSDTLLLADVFENFRNKCLEIYELDPAKFLSAPALA